jgi:MFS family permease
VIALGLVLVGVGSALTALAPSALFLLLAFAVLFGIGDFATIAPTSSLGAEYFGHRGVGTVLGILALSHQIGSAVGSTATGVLYQLSGSYTLPIPLSVLLLIAAAVLSFALPAESRRPLAVAATG